MKTDNLSKKDQATQAIMEIVVRGLNELPAGNSRDEMNDPDHNLNPGAIMIDIDGDFDVVVIDPSCMSSSGGKDALAEKMSEFIKEHRIQAVALMSPVWMNNFYNKLTEAEREDVKGMDEDQTSEFIDRIRRERIAKNLGEEPDSVELITIWSVDAEAGSIIMAPIIRSQDKSPSVGRWDTIPNSQQDRFMPSLQAALKAVQTTK